jgi:hypothetical protein
MGINTILGNVVAVIASLKNAAGYRFDSCLFCTLTKKMLAFG